MKKISIILLTMVMGICLFAVPSFADSEDYNVEVTANYWASMGNLAGVRVYSPLLRLKITNNKAQEKASYSADIIFLIDDEKEIWDYNTYTQFSMADEALEPGFEWSSTVQPENRSAFKVPEDSLPSLTAIIFINNKCYGSIAIAKTYDSSEKAGTGSLSEREENTGGVQNGDENEILFRNIPWGSSAYDVVYELCQYNGKLYYDDISESSYKSWEWEEDDEDIVSTYTIDDLGFLIDENFHDLSVAGYNVDRIAARFLYSIEDNKVQDTPEKSYLYKASYYFDVDDMEEAFCVLQQKLTSLYGEPETGSFGVTKWSGTRYACDWAEWRGDHDTGVLLRYNYELRSETRADQDLILDYGKTNSYELASEIQKTIENENMENEIEQSKNDNVDGL